MNKKERKTIALLLCAVLLAAHAVCLRGPAGCQHRRLRRVRAPWHLPRNKPKAEPLP